MTAEDVDLSAIIPLQDEEENVAPLLSQLAGVLTSMGGDFEIIAVNDGSRDGTLAALRAAAPDTPGLRIIDLTRNFGQTAAIMAGFDHARGRTIVTLDGDLQNDPADIPALVAELEDGADLVSGWRRHRRDAFLPRVLPSRAANWLISKTLGLALHDYGCTLKAYRREVVDDLKLYGEMHRFIPAIAHAKGARVRELEVNHRARLRGQTKYGLGRTLKVVLDLMLMVFLSQYHTKPIRFFGGLGLVTGGLGGICFLLVLYMKLASGTDMTGNPLLIIAVLFSLVAVQLLSLGILGELTVRTYYESQDRKTYSVREIAP